MLEQRISKLTMWLMLNVRDSPDSSEDTEVAVEEKSYIPRQDVVMRGYAPVVMLSEQSDLQEVQAFVSLLAQQMQVTHIMGCVMLWLLADPCSAKHQSWLNSACKT